MDLDKSFSSFKDLEEDGSDIFKSLIDEDSDYLNNNLQRSMVQDSSYWVKGSEQSVESDHSDIIEQPLLIKKQHRRQFHNRLELILQRTRPNKKLEIQQCSLDTSVILIKLLNTKRIYRLVFNIYIILNIIFRVMCIGITFYQSVYYIFDNEWSCWWCLGGLFLSRLLFGLSISKLLNIGDYTKDKSIKIVYETYLKSFEDIQIKIRQLETQTNLTVRRNQADEAQHFKITKQIQGLQKWIFCLKTYLIFIPPELSFLQLRKQSYGFFQVQNFIMKSIELFTFSPSFLYFITSFNVKDVGKIFIFQYTENQIQSIFLILLFIDFASFMIITFLLLYIGNKKQKINPN